MEKRVLICLAGQRQPQTTALRFVVPSIRVPPYASQRIPCYPCMTLPYTAEDEMSTSLRACDVSSCCVFVFFLKAYRKKGSLKGLGVVFNGF